MKVPFPVRAMPSLTFRAWLTPPPLAPGAARHDLGALHDFQPCYFGGMPGYEIGEGPVVIAAHGWGGRPGQMAPMARKLANEGYRVLVPRLPGHAGGPATDIKEVARALCAVVEDSGRPQVVIAHSFASMALRLAFRSHVPPRVVLVAPALDVDDALDVFGDRLRLLPWARRGLRERLRAWDPRLWPLVAGLYPDQMPGADILIVHDPNDRETPFSRSAELAAIRPGTSILAVEGAGHSRILSDSATVDAVAEFASQPLRGETAA